MGIFSWQDINVEGKNLTLRFFIKSMYLCFIFEFKRNAQSDYTTKIFYTLM